MATIAIMANGAQSFQFARPPEEVFTPRSRDVNPLMYVPRPSLEESLTRHIAGTQHVVMFGDSGTGKTWLYKHVLGDDNRYLVIPINLANAAAGRTGSVTRAISLAATPIGEAEKVGFKETKQAEIGVPGIAKGSLNHEGHYEIIEAEELLVAFQRVRHVAGSRIAVLVLDNLEAIFDDPGRMKELANIVLLCDDQRYGEYDIHLLIVGIEAQLREYYTKVQPFLSVTTRLVELPQVRGFRVEDTMALVKRGFVEQLQVAISAKELAQLQQHVHYVTLGIPFHIHQYCLELAYTIADSGGKYSRALVLPLADQRWLSNSLVQNYGVIEGLMNSRETKVGRKNQILFVLGTLDDYNFNAATIDRLVRQHFPKSTYGKSNLNVPTVLAEIADSAPSPLRRSSKGNSFMLRDPKFRMCLRAMLVKGDDERVIKLDLQSVQARPTH